MLQLREFLAVWYFWGQLKEVKADFISVIIDYKFSLAVTEGGVKS